MRAHSAITRGRYIPTWRAHTRVYYSTLCAGRTMFTLTVAGALSLCAVSSSRQLPTGPGYAFSGDDARGAPPPPKAPLSFAASLDDYAVLQSKTGGDAYVYGTTASTAAVTVKVSGAGCPSLIVEAELSALPTAPGRLSVTTRAPPPPPTGNAWKAKVPGAPGGDCTIVASDGKNSVTLNHVTYGDVCAPAFHAFSSIPLTGRGRWVSLLYRCGIAAASRTWRCPSPTPSHDSSRKPLSAQANTPTFALSRWLET